MIAVNLLLSPLADQVQQLVNFLAINGIKAK
jgi:hypothetical protein